MRQDTNRCNSQFGPDVMYSSYQMSFANNKNPSATIQHFLPNEAISFYVGLFDQETELLHPAFDLVLIPQAKPEAFADMAHSILN